MRTGKSLILFVLSLTLTACGHHESKNSGYLKPADQFIGKKDKLTSVLKEGDVEGLTDLLNQGLNVNARLDGERTLLIDVTIQNHIRLIALLLRRGADRTLTDGRGRTALDYAQENGNPRAWILLDQTRHDSERGALIDAIKRKRSQLVQQKLGDGVDPNFTDTLSGGETPLTLAIQASTPLIAKKLAEWTDELNLTSTDVNLPNASGVRALTFAKAKDLQELIEILNSKGAKE